MTYKEMAAAVGLCKVPTRNWMTVVIVPVEFLVFCLFGVFFILLD